MSKRRKKQNKYQQGGPLPVGQSRLGFTVTDDPDPKDVALTHGEDMATAQRSILVNALVLAAASPQTLMAIGSKRPETLRKLKELEDIIVDMGRRIPTGALPEMSSNLPNEIDALYQLQDQYLPSANYKVEQKQDGGVTAKNRPPMKKRKYQQGGNIPDFSNLIIRLSYPPPIPTTQNAPPIDTRFGENMSSAYSDLINYIKSPIYLERLSNFRSEDSAKRSQGERLYNLYSADVREATPIMSDKIKRAQIVGQYLPKNHEVIIPESVGKGTALHELTHASTVGDTYLNEKERQFISDRIGVPKNGGEFEKYLTRPTEYHARLTELKVLAHDKGLIDINSPVTLRDFLKLTSSSDPEIIRTLEEVLSVLKGDGLLEKIDSFQEMWNKLADTGADDTVKTAKLGGLMKKQKYQQGGFADLFGNLGNLQGLESLIGGLGGNEFTYDDALAFGMENMPGATNKALRRDNEKPFLNLGLNQFAQAQSQNDLQSFLENPTVEGLEIYGQGLPRGVRNRIEGRLNRGAGFDQLTNRQQRLLRESAQAGANRQQSTLPTDYQNQANQFGGLFDLFQGLFSFQKGGVASDDKVSKKISKLMGEGYPQKQAVAIALNMKRRNKLPLGGLIPYESQMGYSQGSPFMNRREINIPGNQITMQNTDIPLALLPNRGNPVIAPPRSGQYYFPGATNVREVRLFQMGGFLPVQLERDELIVLPDASIVDTKAKEKHKSMKKDHVTDILPEGSFVGSADKKTKLKKKSAENVSFGYEPVAYEEDRVGKEPKELLFSEIFKDDDELLPADLLRRIRRMYPMSDREDDGFADKAKEENRDSRIPNIAATVFMTKHDPAKLQLGGRVKKTNISDLLGKPEAPEDGMVIPNAPPNDSVPKGQLGLDLLGPIVQAGTQLLTLPFNLMAAGQQRRDAARQLQQNLATIGQGAQNQQGFATLGTGLGAASVLAQNPYVQAPQFDESLLQSLPQAIPQSIFDAYAAQSNAAIRPISNALFANTGNFSRAVNSLAPFTAQRMAGLSNLGIQSALQNINLRRDYLTRLNELRQRQALADTDARNRTQGNANFLLSQLGNLGIGYGNQLGQIDANRVTNTLGARGANFAAQQQALQNQVGAVNNTLGGLAGLGYGFSPYLQQQPNQPFSSIYPNPYAYNNPFNNLPPATLFPG